MIGRIHGIADGDRAPRVRERFLAMAGEAVCACERGLRFRDAHVGIAVSGARDREQLVELRHGGVAATGVDAGGTERAERIRDALQGLRAEGGGSSQAPSRALLLAEPPSADAGEITDKGYINQRAVLGRRAADVLALYSAVPNPEVIRI